MSSGFPTWPPAAEPGPGRAVELEGLSASPSPRCWLSGAKGGGPLPLGRQGALGLGLEAPDLWYFTESFSVCFPRRPLPSGGRGLPHSLRLVFAPVTALPSVLSLYPLFYCFILCFILSGIRFQGVLALGLLDALSRLAEPLSFQDDFLDFQPAVPLAVPGCPCLQKSQLRHRAAAHRERRAGATGRRRARAIGCRIPPASKVAFFYGIKQLLASFLLPGAGWSPRGGGEAAVAPGLKLSLERDANEPCCSTGTPGFCRTPRRSGRAAGKQS